MGGEPVPEPSRRDRGALEAEVLAALGSAGRALTPAQVLAELGGGLAYTTVMTTLARLHGKGALTRERAGRTFAYAVRGAPEICIIDSTERPDQVAAKVSERWRTMTADGLRRTAHDAPRTIG